MRESHAKCVRLGRSGKQLTECLPYTIAAVQSEEGVSVHPPEINF